MAAPARTLLAPNPNDPVQAVRRFNRFYTGQIGVLQEHLLHSQFSLTEVRVLYELAHSERVTGVELCQELGLDRGYLSRMLQSFEKQRLIKTTPCPADRRRIFLSLTRKGQKVFTPLDRRSSEEVASMLKRLSPAQQEKLLGAMREIEGALNLTPKPTLSQKTRKDGAPSEKPLTAECAEVPQRNAGSFKSTMPTERPIPQSQPAYILRQHRPGDLGWVVQRHGVLYWKEYGYDERFEALVAGIVAEFIQNLDSKCE